MELIADGLLIATAMTAGLYCLVLSKRLRLLTDSGNGIGPQIEALDQALGILLRGGDPGMLGRSLTGLAARLKERRKRAKTAALTPVRCQEPACTFTASSTADLWAHAAKRHGSSREAQRYSTKR